MHEKYTCEVYTFMCACKGVVQDDMRGSTIPVEVKRGLLSR